MTGRRLSVLAVLAATQLIGVIDFSIVIVALPTIGHQFGLRADQFQWVISAYGLMQAGFVLLGGRICDAFDAKRVFMAALAVFGVASLAGGLAPNAPLLFAARGVQGLAGAVLAPGSLVLLTREFEEGQARNRALGVFGAVGALGFLIGVLLGGTLTGFLGWRSVFLVNVPVVALMLAASAVLLRPKDSGQIHPRLDLPGAAIGTTALLALVTGVSTSSGGILRMAPFIALAGALLLVFIWIERIAPNPLVPFAVFRSRQFTGANVVFGLTNLAGLIVPFTVTLVLQRSFGLSPQATGLIFVPAGLAAIAGGVLTGLAVRRVGLRGTVVAGLAILVGGGAVLLGPGLHGSVPWIAFGFAVGGFGIVACSVANTIAATSSVTHERMGLAGGLLNTSQFLCGAIGSAVAGALDAPGTVSAYTISIVAAQVVLVLAGAIAVSAYAPARRVSDQRVQPVGETPGPRKAV